MPRNWHTGIETAFSDKWFNKCCIPSTCAKQFQYHSNPCLNCACCMYWSYTPTLNIPYGTTVQSRKHETSSVMSQAVYITWNWYQYQSRAIKFWICFIINTVTYWNYYAVHSNTSLQESYFCVCFDRENKLDFVSLSRLLLVSSHCKVFCINMLLELKLF